MSMRWDNVIGTIIFAFLVSINAFAQGPANGSQTVSASDSLNIVDDGGSLKIAPAGSQPTPAPQSQRPGMPGMPGRTGPDSTDIGAGGLTPSNTLQLPPLPSDPIQSMGSPPDMKQMPSSNMKQMPSSNIMQMPSTSNQNMGSPPGELQMPSAPNQGMVPLPPAEQSIPVPQRGSMQN